MPRLTRLALVLAAAPAVAGDDIVTPPPEFPPPYGSAAGVFNDPVFTPDVASAVLGEGGSGGAAAPGAAEAPAGAGQGEVVVAQAYPSAASPADTARLYARVYGAFEYCSAIARREYVVDCLSYRFDVLSEVLPDTGDYAPVRAALADASARLDAVVERWPSPDLAAGVARSAGPNPEVTARPLRPVATAAADRAIAEAAAVVEETRTVLLRQAPGSAAQAEVFQQVSAALETGTVLLREV